MVMYPQKNQKDQRWYYTQTHEKSEEGASASSSSASSSPKRTPDGQAALQRPGTNLPRPIPAARQLRQRRQTRPLRSEGRRSSRAPPPPCPRTPPPSSSPCGRNCGGEQWRGLQWLAAARVATTSAVVAVAAAWRLHRVQPWPTGKV